MNDRPTTTPSSDILAARSVAYSFVSALFSEPDSERFRSLTERKLKESIRLCCNHLDKDLGDCTEKIFDFLEKDAAAIREERIRLFGHTLSKDASPYELEYAGNQEVFAVTQSLADINGFYRAFGLQVNAEERADHVAVESEFLSHLLLKEVLAHQKGETENIEVCEKAWRDFQNDHFYWWIPEFARRLAVQPCAPFFTLVSQFLQRLLALENPSQHSKQ